MGAGKFSAGSGNRRKVEPELVSRLRRLPVGELPDPRFKAELRSQLVAITPRIVAESPPATSSKTAQSAAVRRLGGFRRPLIAFTSAAAVLVLLLGLAVWMAGRALPGQSLYGIKRASENFQLSVAGSDTGKGEKYLKLATSRLHESSKLTGSSQADPHTASLVASTLRSADSDVRNGARLLTTAAVAQTSADPLTKISGWLSQQRTQLATLAPQLPAGPARSQASSSLALLQQVAVRTSQLKAELGCVCLSQANADELGPLPCRNCTSKNAPGLPGGPGGGTSGLPSLPTGLPFSPGSGTPSLPGLGGSGGAVPTGASGLPSGVPSLPSGVPSLPSGAPSSPVSVGSSGVSVGVPGASISAGPGGISIAISPTLP